MPHFVIFREFLSLNSVKRPNTPNAPVSTRDATFHNVTKSLGIVFESPNTHISQSSIPFTLVSSIRKEMFPQEGPGFLIILSGELGDLYALSGELRNAGQAETDQHLLMFATLLMLELCQDF
jgi:hypothetical protein